MFFKAAFTLSGLQFPNGTLTLFCSIHICVTYLNTQVGVADHFVKDVRECTAEILKDSSVKTSGMVRNLPQFFFPSSGTLKNKKIKEEINSKLQYTINYNTQQAYPSGFTSCISSCAMKHISVYSVLLLLEGMAVFCVFLTGIL